MLISAVAHYWPMISELAVYLGLVQQGASIVKGALAMSSDIIFNNFMLRDLVEWQMAEIWQACAVCHTSMKIS